MPKMKTHRGAAKRFKKTANGNFKRRRAFRGRIGPGAYAERDAGKRRSWHYGALVDETNVPAIKRLLPYA
jgi:large subunit ribosomal protein L35